MIQTILSQKLAQLPLFIKKKAKTFLNINYLAHFFLIFSVICLAFFYLSQDKQWVFLSGLGGKCLDFEDKDFINGANVIAYECIPHKDTQSFKINTNKIFFEDKCLDTLGEDEDGTNLAFRTCKDIKTQQWHYDNAQNTITNSSGKCIDVAGGDEYWKDQQALILWTCNGKDNQKWYLSKAVAKKSIKLQNVISANEFANVIASKNVVAERSGKLNFKNGYKDGFLLSQDKSSLVDLSEEEYLVPAGVVDDGLFN